MKNVAKKNTIKHVSASALNSMRTALYNKIMSGKAEVSDITATSGFIRSCYAEKRQHMQMCVSVGADIPAEVFDFLNTKKPNKVIDVTSQTQVVTPKRKQLSAPRRIKSSK